MNEDTHVLGDCNMCPRGIWKVGGKKKKTVFSLWRGKCQSDPKTLTPNLSSAGAAASQQQATIASAGLKRGSVCGEQPDLVVAVGLIHGTVVSGVVEDPRLHGLPAFLHLFHHATSSFQTENPVMNWARLLSSTWKHHATCLLGADKVPHPVSRQSITLHAKTESHTPFGIERVKQLTQIFFLSKKG
jgi:hypothetical protein